MSLAVLQELESTGLRESLRLVDLPPLWFVVMVVAPFVAAVAWWGYRSETLSSPVRIVLVALRLAALTLLLLVIFRPVRVERREEVQKAEVLLLIDDSASMQKKDAYLGDEPTRRAAAQLGRREPSEVSRSELAVRAVAERLAPELLRRGYQPRALAFAEGLTPHNLDNLVLGARGSTTPIGDSLSGALAAFRGHHLTDVIVVSDGRQTSGSSASEAARAAAGAGVGVHSLIIGDVRTERNLRLELVEAPTDALEGDEIAITVRVVARGGTAGARSSITLEELTGEDGRESTIAEEDIELSQGGARRTLVARPGPADARTAERRFRLRVPPLPEEAQIDDNQLEVSVHVRPEKVRVLFIEAYPRWEYIYVKELLKRADENLTVQCFLLSATPGYPQESSRGLAPLVEVPVERKTLFDSYDVVLLGDVNPYALSPDPARCEEFLKNLREFVEGGGGLCFLAGEYDNPRAFLHTPLEELLPVVIEPAEAQGLSGDLTRAWRPLLEDPQNPHEIVRLVGDAAQNRVLWEDPGGLHGQYWYQPVTRAKPASQVLLRHPTDGVGGERYPLLVAGYFPTGRTLFLGLDSTWLWRFHYLAMHEKFWRNAVRWLSLGRLKSGDRRWRIEVARSTYNLGERAAVEARVLDLDYRPSAEATQSVRWSDGAESPKDLDLAVVAGKPGVFRGSFETHRMGLHRVWIEKDGQRIASAEFEVVLPSLESQDPSPDPALLAEIAAISGGRAVELSRLEDLFESFPGGEERREPISSRLEDVWDRWATLLLALTLFSIEWVLRKRHDLV